MLNGHRTDELKVRAGVHPDALESDSEEVFEFNSFANAMCSIHAAKAIHYGDYLKTHGDESVELFAVQHFCDIKRKYVRAKTFIERMTRGESVDFTDLLDTYSDLAVYAVMGLQMAFHCREKTQVDSYAGLPRVAPCIASEVKDRRILGDSLDFCIHGSLLNVPCTHCDEGIPF